MKRYITSVLIACFLLSACSSNWAVVEPVDALKQRLALWNGETTQRLVNQIGPATGTGADAEGNEVLEYHKEIVAPDNKLWHCKVQFTIDNARNIIATRLVSRSENVWGDYMPCVHIIQVPN